MDRFLRLFSPTRKAVAANTISQLVGRAVGALTTFVITLVIARQLGAAGYGDFVKITTYIAFFFLLADFGINAIFLQHATTARAWSSLVVLRACLGVLLAVCSVAVLLLFPMGSTQGYTALVRVGILLYSPAILFQALITTSNAMFQKSLRYDLSAWAVVVGSVISLAAIWVLFFLSQNATVLSAITILLVGAAATAASSLFFARRLQPSSLFPLSKRDMIGLFVSSIPLGLTLLFNLVYFHADSVILTLTRPTNEVGIYGLAYKVFELVLVFPTFFMNAVYPLFLKASAPSKKFTSVFLQSFLFLFGVSVCATIVLWFFAPLVSFIKSDFVASIGALRVLALGLPFFFLSSVTMWGLIALKKQRILALVYGISMVVNIVGNIVFVPTYGYMGAAWITVASEGLVLVMSGYILLQSASTVKK